MTEHPNDRRCRCCGTLYIHCAAPHGKACCIRCNHYPQGYRRAMSVDAMPLQAHHLPVDWLVLFVCAITFGLAAAAIVFMVLRG